MKFSNLENLMRVTDWIRRFIMKLKKSAEAYGTLISGELLEDLNYLIQNK